MVDSSPASRPLATVDVSVAPMDRPRMLAHHGVFIPDGRIVALQPSGPVPPPADAPCSHGQGAYLLPGLADMPVHYTAP